MRRSQFVGAASGIVAAAAFPAATFAANATVRIGYLDSFSGVFSDIANYHKIGAQIAVDEANASGRVKYELVLGDDGSKPQSGITEMRRLIDQEKIDLALHGTSSAVALAITPLTLEAGVFTMLMGAQDSTLTGTRATATAFRLPPDAQMFARALGRRILAGGKRWYFIVADYAFGRDGYRALSGLLKGAGGTELGADFLKLGTTDFSSTLTKIRDLQCDQVVLCAGGLDVAVAARQFVDFGLHKRMRLAGITLEDFYYKTLPLDELAGSVFAAYWTPNVSPSAKRLALTLGQKIGSSFVSARHYLGYLSTKALIERVNAVGTTRADAVVGAFKDHRFQAYKERSSTWRGCDHQAQQDVYAGATVSRARFAKTNTLLDIVARVDVAESLPACGSGTSALATAAIAGQHIGERPAKTF